jgi:hypothetical protein
VSHSCRPSEQGTFLGFRVALHAGRVEEIVPLPLGKRLGSLFEPGRVPQGQGPRVLHTACSS